MLLRLPVRLMGQIWWPLVVQLRMPTFKESLSETSLTFLYIYSANNILVVQEMLCALVISFSGESIGAGVVGWIGYNDKMDEGTWVWYDGSPSESRNCFFETIYVWYPFSTEEKGNLQSKLNCSSVLATYLKWMPGDPDQDTAANCAAMMANGEWNSLVCDWDERMYPYVCEKGTEKIKKPWYLLQN